jgi:hypothetical protein
MPASTMATFQEASKPSKGEGKANEADLNMPTEQLDPAERDQPLSPRPADAPRPITRPIARRAWAERRVRVWWILGFAVLGVASYYAVTRFYLWNLETRLVTRGEKIEAEVMGWDIGADNPKNKVVPPDTAVDVQYTYKGVTYRPHGVLAGRKESIFTGHAVPLFIDPADPTHWTARTTPGALSDELLSAGIIAPFIPIFFAAAFLRRRSVLRIYRQGEAVSAEILAVGHSAAAPFSRLLRCAIQAGNDVRVIKVLLPTRKSPTVGESLWLIAPPDNAEHAIPAALFD